MIDKNKTGKFIMNNPKDEESEGETQSNNDDYGVNPNNEQWEATLWDIDGME